MSLPKYPALLVERSGLWITAGLTVVLLAQIWPVVPIATAILLIGRGAAGLMELRAHRGTVSTPMALLLLTVYGLLVCLALGAEWDLVLKGTGGLVRPVVVIDTALAVAGLAIVVCRTAKFTVDPV
jgi:hypothetical protein